MRGGAAAGAPAGAAPEGPGHVAARSARDLIEEALFSLAEIARVFDRYGVRDRLLRAIHLLYVVGDTPVVAIAHREGLGEVAAVTAECAALLSGASGAGSTVPLERAIAALQQAGGILRTAAEAVARIQLERRAELVGSGLDEEPLPVRPFRASAGTPSLHAFARRPMVPHVSVEPKADAPPAPGPAPRPPRVKTVEELKALLAAEAGAVQRTSAPEPARAAAKPPDAPLAFTPAIEEVELVRRLGRDCLEDIANLRNLRKPNALESWQDQEPFEARLFANVDAFAALGSAALPTVSLYHAEAEAPDPERAFAVALVLGCVEGTDTAGAAVMTLKQSAPEEHPGWVEGLWLAPNPAIDRAMADLATNPKIPFAALALDVLHARGNTPDSVVTALLARAEPEIAVRVARALATALPARSAIDHLTRLAATTEDDVFLAAVEALLRRKYGPALDLLREAVDARGPRAERALPLLCFVGRAGNLDRLLAAASVAQTVQLLRGLGRFGHVGSLEPLCGFLEHEDGEVAAAAAEALERIAGSGLRETVEEPWEVELPPEAAESGGIAVPLRKVERVVTDVERWSAWLRDHARRFNAKLKTRNGVPFVPLAVVDELAAVTTPPARREEAALELALVTGLTSPFSPYDWVARQKQHLAELRAEVAKLSVTPGAWPSASARHDAPPVQNVPAPVQVVSAPVQIVSIREATDAPASREPGPVLPKLPIVSPASPLAGTMQFPEGLMAALGKVALPFAESPTGAALPRKEAPPDSQPQHAAGRVPRELAPQTSKGVRDLQVPGTAPKVFSTGSLGTTGELPRDLVAQLAKGALPFQASRREAPSPADKAEEATTEELPLDFATKPAQAPLPSGPKSPSAPIASPPGAGAPATAKVGLMTGELPRDLVAQLAKGALPFQASRREGPTAPAAPATAPLSPPAPSGNALPTLSLQDYASLCAEVAVFSDKSEAIFKRYGLHDAQGRRTVDVSWQERLRGNPEEQRGWQMLYARWVAHFERLRSGGGT